MLLIVTNSHDPTVDFVEEHLQVQYKQYWRLNTDKFFTHFLNTTYIDSSDPTMDSMVIDMEGQVVSLNRVSAVWYRRPVDPDPYLSAASPQATRYAKAEGYYYIRNLWRMLTNSVWVSRPQAISWASVKLDQLKMARSFGLTIPKSLATTDPDKAREFYEQCGGNAIVKPFTVSDLEYGDQTVVMLTTRVTDELMLKIDQVRNGITFFQEEIQKIYEVRVTVIGDHVFCARIDSQSDPNRQVDWRSTSPQEPEWRRAEVPADIQFACKRMVEYYDLQFGAFDFAVTPAGEYVFFEMNPNGQWAWLEIELGLPMTSALIKTFGI